MNKYLFHLSFTDTIYEKSSRGLEISYNNESYPEIISLTGDVSDSVEEREKDPWEKALEYEIVDIDTLYNLDVTDNFEKTNNASERQSQFEDNEQNIQLNLSR